MNSSNGHTPYVTLADLRENRRLEDDVTVPETGHRYRVQALTNEEFRLIQAESTDAEGVQDTILYSQLAAAYGLVEPRLDIGRDRDGAVALAQGLPIPDVRTLARRITELTAGNAKESAQSFTDGSGSPAPEAATAPTTSTSPDSATSPTPVSSTPS